VRTREHGFTLIELLIALTLFGILTTMLFMGFRLGIRSANKVAESIDKSSTLPILHDFLRAQFASAQPIVRDGSSEKIILFDGRPDSVYFVGTPPDALSAGGGLQRFSIELNKDGDGRRIVLRRRLYQGKQSKAEERDDEPLLLLADVASLQFGYFGTSEPLRGPEWQGNWREMTRLPSLIRVRIEFADGRQAPDLVVALRLAENPEPFSVAQVTTR
jgi:general secretion pathway protein J